MTVTCATCGAEVVSEARFCRRCGAPVRASGHAGGAGSEQISPQAATIPLREEGRTTDGLAGEDPRRSTPETKRVSRAELDSILQRAERATQGAEPDADAARTLGQETIPDVGGATRPPQSSGLSQPASPPSEADFLKTRPSVPSEDFLKTRPSVPDDPEEELTVIVPRPFMGDINPAPVQPTPITGELAGQRVAGPTSGAAGRDAPPPTHGPAGQAAPARKRRGLWVLVAVACAALLVVAVVGAWLAVNYLRRPATDSATVAPVAPVAPDQRQLAEEKVTEAEALLASGDLSGAVERLREAVRLDPNHTRAHRRLGDILLETGARAEAIEELRSVTRLEPNDFTAWRALATAQLAEGLPAEAAESYKRLVALTGETDANDLLAYADALRLSGRAEEAHTLYQRLSTSTSADVAASARQHLTELVAAVTAPTPTSTRDPRHVGDANANAAPAAQPTTVETAPTPVAQASAAPTSQPTPPPAELTPAERYRRGVELWGSNRGAAVNEFRAAAAAGNPDANYYLGLNLVEGRDLSALKRAEVVAALSYFQRAQAGSHGAQARRYAQQLEKEYDRIRGQQQ